VRSANDTIGCACNKIEGLQESKIERVFELLKLQDISSLHLNFMSKILNNQLMLLNKNCVSILLTGSPSINYVLQCKLSYLSLLDSNWQNQCCIAGGISWMEYCECKAVLKWSPKQSLNAIRNSFDCTHREKFRWLSRDFALNESI